MSRTTRPIVAALGALALAAGLSACGGEAAGETGDALSDVTFIHDGVLTVCSDIPYEPFEYKADGGYTGFDVDLGKQVAKKLGVKLEMVDSNFDAISDGSVLNDGDCDVAISAMTITGQRSRLVDFSSPYFDAKQVMIADKGSGITTIEGLDGKRVGVQANTTGETYLRDFAPEGTKIVPYVDSVDMKQALRDGSVEAIVLDNTISGPVIEANPDLRVAQEFDTGEQYGMAVRKDGNIPLLREIDSVLAELRKDGSYDKIFNTYF
jgi:polar amino acid transport system substrate-binding protein